MSSIFQIQAVILLQKGVDVKEQNNDKFRCLVIGMGPVGHVIAASLKAAGHHVTALCRREDQARELNTTPLSVSGKLELEQHIDKASTDMAAVMRDQPDLVLICVKSTGSAGLVKQLKKYDPPGKCTYIACQNGLDVEQHLAHEFGAGRWIRMVLNMGCGFTSPHHVHVGFLMPHIFSWQYRASPGISMPLASSLSETGLVVKVEQNYQLYAHRKAILNASLGTVSALTRQTMGEVMDDPELNRMVGALVREGIAVAQGLGLSIEDSYYDEAMSYLSGGGNHKPSILVDIENGRTTENEYLCGKIFHHGHRLGINTDVTQTVYYLINSLEGSARRQKERSRREQLKEITP